MKYITQYIHAYIAMHDAANVVGRLVVVHGR